MTERSLTPPANVPPLKRQEFPSEEGPDTSTTCLLDDTTLKETLQLLRQVYMLEKTNRELTEENVKYSGIYWQLYGIFSKNDLFVSEEEFQENIKLQRHDFFIVLRRGVDEGASSADRDAVVSHSTYFYMGVIRS